MIIPVFFFWPVKLLSCWHGWDKAWENVDVTICYEELSLRQRMMSHSLDKLPGL